MADDPVVFQLAEAAQDEALKLTPAELVEAVHDSAMHIPSRDDVSFHYKITPQDMARVDRLIGLYSQGRRLITRNDIVRAAVIVFLDVTEKTLLPERARQAQTAVTRLLAVLTDLPQDEIQNLRRRLFEQ